MSVDQVATLRSIIRHRAFVADGLSRIARAVSARAEVHDLSKLLDDEFEGFARINAVARTFKFGSPEYAASIESERPTVELHYSRNRHHPEFHGHPAEGRVATGAEALAERMTFLDIIEMVVDWWAAHNGYGGSASGSGWLESASLNLLKKGAYLSREQRWLAEEVIRVLDEGEVA